MSRCGELVPKGGSGGIPLVRNECGECLLSEGHTSEHLVLAPDFGYYIWMPQEWYCINDGEVCDCGCIECYTYENISDELARDMIRAYGSGTD